MSLADELLADLEDDNDDEELEKLEKAVKTEKSDEEGKKQFFLMFSNVLKFQINFRCLRSRR